MDDRYAWLDTATPDPEESAPTPEQRTAAHAALDVVARLALDRVYERATTELRDLAFDLHKTGS